MQDFRDIWVIGSNVNNYAFYFRVLFGALHYFDSSGNGVIIERLFWVFSIQGIGNGQYSIIHAYGVYGPILYAGLDFIVNSLRFLSTAQGQDWDKENEQD